MPLTIGRIIAFALILPILSTTSGWAADKQGAYALRGPGALSCADFLQARQEKDRGKGFLLWVDGYLSAANLFSRDTFDLLPWGNESYLAVLLEGHCKRHPKQPFHVAVNKLLEGLSDLRLRNQSPQIEAKQGGAKVLVYQDTLKRLQKRLKREGVYSGEVHGRYDQATAEAIRRFQKKRGLPATGLPDYMTLHALFLAPHQGEGK